MSDGLADVIAAKTVLSHADAENGTVWVRGHRIGDLVARYGYEGKIALIWEGFAGDDLTREGVLAQLGLASKLAFSRLDDWLPAAKRRPLIEAARMALAALPKDSNAAAIAATLPVVIAALLRVRQGNAPVAPDDTLTTAADFLRMLRGTPAPMVHLREACTAGRLRSRSTCSMRFPKPATSMPGSTARWRAGDG